MNIPIILSLFFAILSPIFFGAMTIVDKYITRHKVRKPLGFAVVVGVAEIVIGSIIALFVSWKGVSAGDLWTAIIPGILYGATIFFYYLILKNEEVSSFVGIIYTYPLVVALFSFIFLKEVLSLVGYAGVALIIMGVLALSLKMKRLKLKSELLMLIIMILVIAATELMIKVTTTKMPEMNGTAITVMFSGFASLFGLFSSKIRKGFVSELKNIKWTAITEGLFIFAVLTLYLAMDGLPATVVSSIAAIEPLAVLMLESFVNKHIGSMAAKGAFRKKVIPLSMIVAGIALLYITQIV